MLISNPVSGRGASLETAEQVKAILGDRGVRSRIRATRAPGHAGELAAEAVKAGIRNIAVCGGDGTIHEVINAVDPGDMVLGIVPAGGGNDAARALGIPVLVEGAALALVDGEPRRIDLGRVNERRFLTVACVGLDASVALAASKRGGGRFRYVGTALREVLKHRPCEVTLDLDGGKLEASVTLLACGNTSSYGGGVRMLPDADPEDGHLDVCLIAGVSRLTALRLLATVYLGRRLTHPSVRTFRTRRLGIESAESQSFVCDGELAGTTPVEVVIEPRALSVQLPARDTEREREDRRASTRADGYPNSASSIAAHQMWITMMWLSWMRGVLCEGMTMPATPSILATAPPSLPLSAMQWMPLWSASSNAFTMFPELPDVVMPISASPCTPNASTCRLKTVS